MEEAEPDRLLDLHVAVDLDVRALPELVEVGALLVEQPLPAGQRGRRHRAAHLVDQGRPGPGGGPAVAEVLDQVELFPGGHLGRDHQPAQVGERLGQDRLAVRALDVMGHRDGDPQLARPGGVHQDRARAPAVHGQVFLADQWLG